MNTYQLREEARRDLEDIWLYTYHHWDATQADHYYQNLINRCAWLAANPKLGKARDDIAKGFFSYPEGMHVVFYTIAATGIEILGFPHQSVDVVKYLER